MYVGKDFDEAEPTEQEVYTFDFVRDLPITETIASVDSWLIELIDGTDATPDNHLIGAPDFTGTQVKQEIGGLVDGCRYRLTAVIVLAPSAQKLSLHSYVTCCGTTPP